MSRRVRGHMIRLRGWKGVCRLLRGQGRAGRWLIPVSWNVLRRRGNNGGIVRRV